MNEKQYQSPELTICWFESEEVIAYSEPVSDQLPGDVVNPDDEW